MQSENIILLNLDFYFLAIIISMDIRNNFAKLNVYFKSTIGVGYIVNHRTTWADYSGMIYLLFIDNVFLRNHNAIYDR